MKFREYLEKVELNEKSYFLGANSVDGVFLVDKKDIKGKELWKQDDFFSELSKMGKDTEYAEVDQKTFDKIKKEYGVN